MKIFRKRPDNLEFVQVYGERNSGTTYLSALLQDNLSRPELLLGLLPSAATPLGIEKFGYKHWFVDEKKLSKPEREKTLFIVIHRDPYRWIHAMLQRPYALKRSLNGCGVSDLATVMLEGHINGKDTKNEFDPVTGERLNIFQLRTKKFEALLNLPDLAENVVFLDASELASHPIATMTKLKTEFPSLFNDTLKLERKPHKELANNVDIDTLFSIEEREVLNQELDWDTEQRFGYMSHQIDASVTTNRIPIVILHGSSATGKTTLMRQLSSNRPTIIGLEMDDCKYWHDSCPVYEADNLVELLPSISKNELLIFQALVDDLNGIKANRSVAFLLEFLKSFMTQDPERLSTSAAIVATCGALPMPASADANDIYVFLASKLPFHFQHVLLDVDTFDHADRIKRRNRQHLKDEIFRIQARNLKHRDRFDYLTRTEQEVRLVMTEILGVDFQISENKLVQVPKLRINKRGLTHIQIYGERNSGTNFLTKLISQNALRPENILGSYGTKADPTNRAKLIGYKHYYPRLDKLSKSQHHTLFIVIYKNPYTWIRSMMSKPYHFQSQLENASIQDLPNIYLRGFDRHGHRIPDVHPETNENINIFDLRKFKIQKWEALVHQVNNVVFLNYENLLLFPNDVIGQIIAEFPELFKERTPIQHQSDQKYLEKYRNPTAFEASELATMDAQFDWESEKQAGYQQGNLFVVN